MSEHDKLVIQGEPRNKAQQAQKKNAANLFRNHIAKNLRSNHAAIWLAEDNGEAIGYSFVQIKQNIRLFNIQKLGHFSDLYVRKEYRRQGISTRFKNEGLKWFRKKGVKYASILVNTVNAPAHHIYKNWGFFDYNIEMRKKI